MVWLDVGLAGVETAGLAGVTLAGMGFGEAVVGATDGASGAQPCRAIASITMPDDNTFIIGWAISLIIRRSSLHTYVVYSVFGKLPQYNFIV